ncbi:unnamed protein product [Rotaria sp. Silwood2]|nr:unnamed protein product [Rotaria sp. Silwood2]CAF4393537.1 unnamed protein product [Rotaria sp. Silwood2]
MANISGERIEIDQQARKALNFIETGELSFKCLFDEQLKVRSVASITLSGFYQYGYIQVNEEDFKHFSQMSKVNDFIKKGGKKIITTEKIIKRHGIKKALSEFHRTHHDSWHQHREKKFTDDQLVIFDDALISLNYYEAIYKQYPTDKEKWLHIEVNKVAINF